jgi:hypothetical protein
LSRWNAKTGDYRRSDQERFTVRAHPNVSFQLDRLEYVGRIKDGEAPIELSPQDVKVEYAPARSAPKLLGAVMPLVDAVASEGTVPYGNWPMVLAFYLYGQGVASFQAAQTLIEAQLPVEALPSLRALTIVAARFEQMRDPKEPGLGIVARMALDGLDEPDVEREYAARRRPEMEAGFASAGLTVPTDLPTVERTLIYHSLSAEMSLARSAANATYGAAGLHIPGEPSDDQIGFRTRLEPGP